MSNLINSLKRLIGRIRMFVNALLQIGVIFVPVGLILFVFSFQSLDGWERSLGGIISVVLIFVGTSTLYFAIRRAMVEDKNNDYKFNLLIQEIRGLKENIIERSGNDELNNKSKQ